MIIESPTYGEINTNELYVFKRGGRRIVYKMSKDKLLKVNENPSMITQRHMNLNGVTFIPHTYERSIGGECEVVEYIDGEEVHSLKNNRIRAAFLDKDIGTKDFFIENDFDLESYMKNVKTFFEECIELGWFPRDLHAGNLLLDHRMNVWVIDTEQFLDLYDRVDSIYYRQHCESDYKMSETYKQMIEIGEEIARLFNDKSDYPGKLQSYMRKYYPDKIKN